MPLAAGTRLGSYEILEPIGASGIGARSISLGTSSFVGTLRSIKILPEELAVDEEREEREERRRSSGVRYGHVGMKSFEWVND